MPAPMMPPITTIVASKGPSARLKSATSVQLPAASFPAAGAALYPRAAELWRAADAAARGTVPAGEPAGGSHGRYTTGKDDVRDAEGDRRALARGARLLDRGHVRRRR